MAILNNQLIEIYNQTLNGGMVLIGNSLHVVGENNNLSREFITANGIYTLDWKLNGSVAYLEIPNGSIVIYAMLEWFSTISNNTVVLNVDSQYTPVSFKTPKADIQISNTDEVQYVIGSNNVYSSKWADVTSYVSTSNSGYYGLSGVPSVNPLDNIDNNNKCGWTLTVVYENLSLPSKQICIYSGMRVADPSMDRNTKAITLNNINVPSITGNAYLTMAVAGGTPNTFGGLDIYDNISKINNQGMIYKLGNYLSANGSDLGITPIVPYDNLFSGTIVNTNIEVSDYGRVDILGTLGNKNNSPYNINDTRKFRGNRSQLDILSFDISNKIYPNQSEIVLVPNQIQNSDFNFGLIYCVQINQGSLKPSFPSDGGPLLSINSFSKQNLVSVGDFIKITLSIINEGPILASNVILFNNTIPNSNFLSNSFYLNGINIFLNSFPYTGINLGDISVNSAVIVEYSIYFYDESFNNPVYASNNIKYSYIYNNNSNKSNTIKVRSNQIIVLRNPLENIKLYIDRYDAISNDNIMYTVIIENTGAITATNVNIKDILPSGLTYVYGSLTINGSSMVGDLNSSIIIPNIYPNNKAIITFETTIN